MASRRTFAQSASKMDNKAQELSPAARAFYARHEARMGRFGPPTFEQWRDAQGERMKGETMDRKPFDQMSEDEQNAIMDEWIREANSKPFSVVMPAETLREGYYHTGPDPIA